MKALRFEGYSDDTFSCGGKGIDVDYDNCASGEPIHMKVTGAGGCVVVTGQYCHGPSMGWGISVAPGADDPDEEAMPDWPIRFVPSERPYSAALVIDAPDDVQVELVHER